MASVGRCRLRHAWPRSRSHGRPSSLLMYLCLPLMLRVTEAVYDPAAKIESARLFGNVNSYAYYYITLEVGLETPQPTTVIVDTGSNICGFPCTGCKHCGRHIDAPFVFNRSVGSIYPKWSDCTRCYGQCVAGRCCYEQYYTEGSSITGHWFEDYVRLGDLNQHNPPLLAQMGCHNYENKLFYTQRANGILGLAPYKGGTPTILYDLFKDNAHVNQNIFSLCLSQWGGRLNVGGFNASYHVLGAQLAWIPLSLGRYYTVQLDALYVGGQLVGNGQDNFGPAMLDSGTTYTYFPSNVFNLIDGIIVSHCRTGICKAQPVGTNCWKLDNISTKATPDFFPVIDMRFGAVAITWIARQYLYQRGDSTFWCRAYADNGLTHQTVLGSTWMIDKEVIFDIDGQQAGIVEATCPSYHYSDQAAPSTLSRKNEEFPAVEKALHNQRLVLGVATLFGVAATAMVLARVLMIVRGGHWRTLVRGAASEETRQSLYESIPYERAGVVNENAE